MQKRAAAFLITLGLAATANAPAAPRHRIIHQQKSLYRNILVVDQAGAQHDLRCMVFGRCTATRAASGRAPAPWCCITHRPCCLH